MLSGYGHTPSSPATTHSEQQFWRRNVFINGTITVCLFAVKSLDLECGGQRPDRALPSLWNPQFALYQQELQATAYRLREYERTTYCAGTWKPEYEQWVRCWLAYTYRGPVRELVAWNAAPLLGMIYTQPVLYELALPKGFSYRKLVCKSLIAVARETGLRRAT
jgi:hypothetical protein